jgi:S-formylglutathione hydrolase FrmB
MSITGLPLLVLVACGAVVLPAVAIATWRRGRLRVVRTIAAVLVGQLLAAAALGLVVNRSQELFTSWSDLFGGAGGRLAKPKVAAGRLDGRALAQLADAKNRGQGVVLSLTVTGAKSGLTLPVKVYLPPQYSQAAYADRRFPVVEVFDGFPGSPSSWLDNLHLASVFDQEIAAGRMAPTIAVLPVQNVSQWRDSEGVNAVRGPQVATFLTTDLQAAMAQQFRVAEDRSGWGTIGYSTGGFMAVNLAMQAPYGYAAAVSLDGYFTPITDRTTGDLYRGSTTARQDNDPMWLLAHRDMPGLAVYLTGSKAEADETRQEQQLADEAASVHGPVSVTTALVPGGGHNFTTWRLVEVPALDWLSGHLTAPLAAPAVVGQPLATPSPTAKHNEAEGTNRP